MSLSTEYKVSFGSIARTLVYEDSLGGICFAFDVSPADDLSKAKWNLHLGRQALTPNGEKLLHNTTAETERIAVALDKIKEYAASRGYLVAIE